MSLSKAVGIDALRRRARSIKRDTYALYLACRDPRTPWYVRALTAAVVAYAISPIDLIPDFIPVVGYLDDLILVPVGLALAVRMIPGPVMADCRERASGATERPTSRAAAAVVVCIWAAAAALCVYLVADVLNLL
ncbi:MAG TPA: YkvA family protein [Chloroflexota bacterium]|nr:YkvA family protein [Chloroflexota bacterium]